MDLETVPFWKDVKLKTYPALTKNTKCDICIVGGGISGLTTAYLLAAQGKKVIVLDDGRVAAGQTMRTTGHLSNALDDRFYKLEGYFGEKGAKMAASSHRAAIDLIASIISKHKIDCDFEWTKAYLFSPNDQQELDKEYKAAKRAGLAIKKIERCPFSSFDTGPTLVFQDQAQFHPLKYVNALCECIEELGGEIYCNSHVTSIEGSYIVKTDRDIVVEATHVVVATNTPVQSRFLPHLKQASYRSYVIAAKVPKGYIPTGLYYDTLDPYHYIRIAKDHSGQEYAIIGGEDHRTGEEKHTDQKFKVLEAWARERFPKMGTVSYHWSGQIIEPVDSLAFIGRIKRGKELYMITGDSGNGLTHGTLGAMLICDLIVKKKSPWEKLYNPHRKTLKATPDFLKENANVALQYTDWITMGEHKKLQPNSGMVVRKGLKKCAIYKDKEGKTHKMSAVCPHLGAIVHWNETEHCWECPAHGSRFDAYGKVIQGPANCNLSSDSRKKKERKAA